VNQACSRHDANLPHFGQRLESRVRLTRSAVCVGLDPRPDQLPDPLRPPADCSAARLAAAYRQFCCDIIDVVAPSVPCVKPQIAFFEALGPDGMLALQAVTRHASRAGLLVIMDAKRGDIGSTAEAYASAYLAGTDRHLSGWPSDALTVNPFLGPESLSPMLDACQQHGCGMFVLVKTSNPGSDFLQAARCGERTVSEALADWVEQQNQPWLSHQPADSRSPSYGPIGSVVGATYPEQLASLRQRMPSAWILVPGYGAQGGTAADTAAAFDGSGLGGIVNSSRGIIFAHRSPEYADLSDWQRAVELAAARMNDDLAEHTSLSQLRR
jgi:orotidine-5'-phosphate decarboxylase